MEGNKIAVFIGGPWDGETRCVGEDAIEILAPSLACPEGLVGLSDSAVRSTEEKQTAYRREVFKAKGLLAPGFDEYYIYRDMSEFKTPSDVMNHLLTFYMRKTQEGS